MSYVNKILNVPFDDALFKVTDELQKEGFGISAKINLKDTLQKKLDIDFNKYVILGVNPNKNSNSTDKLGLMFIVKELSDKEIDVLAINSTENKHSINQNLPINSNKVQAKINRVINNL